RRHLAAAVAPSRPGARRAAPHRVARRAGASLPRVLSRRRGLRAQGTLRRMKSLQETYAPANRCFGCGPANDKGLRIRSFVAEDDPGALICEWRPEPHHVAFDSILNGGICGALLDCHSNWTAAMHLMKQQGVDTP